MSSGHFGYRFQFFSLRSPLAFRLFTPELPHGNLLIVGAVVALLSSVSIIVWWASGVTSLGNRTSDHCLDYLEQALTFFSSATLSAVALFGAIFFASISNMWMYNEKVVEAPSELFKLNLFTGMQHGFFATYAIALPIRHLFLASISLLQRYEQIATQTGESGFALPLPHFSP